MQLLASLCQVPQRQLKQILGVIFKMNYSNFVKNIFEESLTKQNISYIIYDAFFSPIFLSAGHIGTTFLFALLMQNTFAQLQNITVANFADAQQQAQHLSGVIWAALLSMVAYVIIVFSLFSVKNIFIYSKIQKYKLNKTIMIKFIFFNIPLGIFIFFMIFILASIARNQETLAILFALFFLIVSYFSTLTQFFFKTKTLKESIKYAVVLGCKKAHIFFSLYLLIAFFSFILLTLTSFFLPSAVPLLLFLLCVEWMWSTTWIVMRRLSL